MEILANRIINYETETKVKNELIKAMEEKGIGGLVRAGS